MPRGVAKAKDSVEKKVVVKKDVVKRSRKMRGGGSFNEYCKTFLNANNTKYNADIDIIKDNLKNLHTNIKPLRSGLKSISDTALISEFRRLVNDKTYENNIPSDLKIVNFKYDNVVYSLDKQIKFLNIMLSEIPNYQGNSGNSDEIIKDEDINILTKKIIFNIIYKLFYHFKQICDKYSKVGDIDLGEITKVEDVKKGKDAVDTELAAEKEAKKAVEAELVAEKEAKKAVDAELAKETAAKDAAVAELATANTAKKQVEAELAKETAAKDAANTKFKKAEEKYKLLQENNILTIDEKYFKNAYDNAKNLSGIEDYVKTEKILNNILAIWENLKDDSIIKRDAKIQKIIGDIETLKKENDEKYKAALSLSGGGGKRKINSSRTKRK
jgi:hypothetical protein